MPSYLVTWDIDADDVCSPREAAEFAWRAMRDPDSIANVFRVCNKHNGKITLVDLSKTIKRRTAPCT
jgi:hypothetical protein